MKILGFTLPTGSAQQTTTPPPTATPSTSTAVDDFDTSTFTPARVTSMPSLSFNYSASAAVTQSAPTPVAVGQVNAVSSSADIFSQQTELPTSPVAASASGATQSAGTIDPGYAAAIQALNGTPFTPIPDPAGELLESDLQIAAQANANGITASMRPYAPPLPTLDQLPRYDDIDSLASYDGVADGLAQMVPAAEENPLATGVALAVGGTALAAYYLTRNSDAPAAAPASTPTAATPAPVAAPAPADTSNFPVSLDPFTPSAFGLTPATPTLDSTANTQATSAVSPASTSVNPFTPSPFGLTPSSTDLFSSGNSPPATQTPAPAPTPPPVGYNPPTDLNLDVGIDDSDDGIDVGE
jgi:hypothetical protein